MASVELNKKVWEKYNWSNLGDEWSSVWGGNQYLWYGTIFPRILKFVPTENILEIAPGFGRCTQYLKDLCKKLVIVDLCENCINHCKKRFSKSSNIEYHQNDGKTLRFIQDNSINFIFSWDSLVHADLKIIKVYLLEFSRVLKPKGFGFIHHSNAGIYGPKLDNSEDHWRARDVTARLFEESCNSVGLQCISQEIIRWGRPKMDCISLFTKSPLSKKVNKVIENDEFNNEIRNLKRISELYDHQKI
ncbi:class I SAM-dependent methyltransferase [Candidatus Woesearchaeota archaeon]|nr:class I SAM-dependent methyltransferase [Candidatus Woesearchaeota archaeon]